ncbi:coiled-coil domain-containing protein 22 [Wolbachia endosymbiont of Chironomus riparius]|uniref:coiled-coil domain-containing protein 22 n=1 Tax=Wolbachia endosymbiont of Chironomus riparius TaxID=2883238 RepID=UPI00209D9B76|nr:coiled-coil domain-containing protein 22 [Wolbachia endosymbiont of Chironomus riparius]
MSIKNYYSHSTDTIPKHLLDNMYESLTVASRSEIEELAKQERKEKTLQLIKEKIDNYEKNIPTKDQERIKLRQEYWKLKDKLEKDKTINTIDISNIKKRKKELDKIINDTHEFNVHYNNLYGQKLSRVEESRKELRKFTDTLKDRYTKIIPNICGDLIKDIDDIYQKDIPEECHQETYLPPPVIKKHGTFAEFLGDFSKNCSNRNDQYLIRRKTVKETQDNEITREKERDIEKTHAKKKIN